MAYSRGSPRGPIRISTRRLTSWQVGPGGTAPTVVNSAVSIFLGSAIQAVTDGVTIIRIRGEFVWWLDLAMASNDGFAGAFGIGIASFAAVTAGAASVPTSITEESSENWLYHRYLSVKSLVAFAAAAAQDGPSVASSVRFEVDTKAMRKLPSDLAIYAMLEVVEVGTAGSQIAFNSRSLIKLP